MKSCFNNKFTSQKTAVNVVIINIKEFTYVFQMWFANFWPDLQQYLWTLCISCKNIMLMSNLNVKC